MREKRILVLFLSAVLVTLLCACGNGIPDTTEEVNIEQQREETQEEQTEGPTEEKQREEQSEEQPKAEEIQEESSAGQQAEQAEERERCPGRHCQCQVTEGSLSVVIEPL